MSLAIDPWADGPLEEPASQSDLTREEWQEIREEIWDGHWNDHALFVECLQEAMKALRDIACGVGQPYMPSLAATQCLRRLAYRAKNGVPFNEPSEPAWSLDTSTHEPLIGPESKGGF